MTIKEFHTSRVKKIKYSCSKAPIVTIDDFYKEFLFQKRIPNPKVIREWHELLVRYINNPMSKTFFVRKYESNKENGKWNNRRGAIIQFNDGFEIVYASNFLAHEIFMMAYNDFVPTDDDFKNTIENRELPITSGTEIEKNIRSYFPCTNKTIDCYFAHIIDVNGKYLRNDSSNSYTALTHDEIKKMYPIGIPENWTNSPDKIYHLPYQLNEEEKALIKAHFLRFLDPMNYFLTPQTKHCKHAINNLSKNIGEYEYLKCYIQEIYKKEFGDTYNEFVKLGRFREEMPEDYTGNEEIHLEYSIDFSLSSSADDEKAGKSARKDSKLTVFSDFISYMPPEKRKTVESYCSSIRRVMEELEFKYLDDFENEIDRAIEYCTEKMCEAKKCGNNKTEKRYSDYRSAIKKYKIFLEQKVLEKL